MTNTTAATAAPKHHAEITLPFGPGDTTFRLPYAEYKTWEDERNKSLMGTLTVMVMTRSGELEDIRALIRLGLVGAGKSYADAISFVGRYVDGRPLEESLVVAITIAEAAVYGSDEWRQANGKAADASA